MLLGKNNNNDKLYLHDYNSLCEAALSYLKYTGKNSSTNVS